MTSFSDKKTWFKVTAHHLLISIIYVKYERDRIKGKLRKYGLDKNFLKSSDDLDLCPRNFG